MLRGAQSVMAQTTGNAGLDALADAIAERVFARLEAAYGHAKTRLLDVPAAAEYLSRTPSAIPIRHMIAKGMAACAWTRPDLDTWVEMGNTNK